MGQAGYGGFYDIELMGEAIENCDYQQLLDRSKQAYDQLISNGRIPAVPAATCE